MQTVWSRIAQTRGTCCCPQCLQSAPGVSRRATASATRRAPQFLTSSTLWYSGIFAAAATFDAGAKIQRREQWDQAIAGVKQELGQSTEQVTRTVKDGKRDAKNAPTTSDAGLEELVATSDAFGEVEPHRRRPRWPTNTGPPLAVNHLPPESIYATEHRQGKAKLRRWTAKKLESVMLSVDALQLRIFWAVQRELDSTWREQASAAVPVAYRDKMFLSEVELNAALDGKREDLRRLWSVDKSLPDWERSEMDIALSRYSQDDEGSFHSVARDLNKSLQDLFRQHTNEAISTPSLLAKVAYNLSLSSAPPNVHTYNTLLLGFGRAQQYDLVYSVIRSLRETHVRPNEVTNSTILNHFTAMEDAPRFVRWIELMRGKHGGLALAREDIKVSEAGAKRLVRFKWRDDAPERVVQMPYPTPNVFSAILKGVLKFSGFDTALSICEGMGHDGWGLCMAGLTPLLLDCADHGDWASGLAVWRQIQALKGRSGQRQGRKAPVVEHIGLGSYAAMLRLCFACNQKNPFQDIWRQALRTHGHLKSSDLTRMIEAQKVHASKPVVKQSEERVPSVLPQLGEAVVGGDATDMIASGTDNEPSGSAQDTWLQLPPLPAGHRNSATSASDIVHELEVSKDGELQGENVASRARTTLEDDQRTSKSASSSKPTSVVVGDHSQLHQGNIILREQLDGWLPPSHELEDYEMRERPMTMHG